MHIVETMSKLIDIITKMSKQIKDLTDVVESQGARIRHLENNTFP